MTTLLEDTEVFVIGTDASCHITGKCIGMTDKKDPIEWGEAVKNGHKRMVDHAVF